MISSLEAIKEACTEEINIQPKYAEDEESLKLAEEIAEEMCPNECSNTDEETRGTCEKGEYIQTLNNGFTVLQL